MTKLKLSLIAVAAASGFLTLNSSAFASAAVPLTCRTGNPLHIRGDAPAAISYDVYSQLYPLSARRLALFEEAGTVKRLPEGLDVCEIADDGVADPSAVLVRGPQDKMAWWVSADHVAPKAANEAND
ncbi:MAG TPA: hypothetical protein VGN31_02855 [Paraburkholderia sp.]|jgi:hypothetical protein